MVINIILLLLCYVKWYGKITEHRFIDRALIERRKSPWNPVGFQGLRGCIILFPADEMPPKLVKMQQVHQIIPQLYDGKTR